MVSVDLGVPVRTIHDAQPKNDDSNLLCDWSAVTSTSFFDGWSFVHAMVGTLQFLIIPLIGYGPQDGNYELGRGWWYLLNLFLHILFEIFENSKPGILLCRTFYPPYQGDHPRNSVGDLVAFTVGYWIEAFWCDTLGDRSILIFVPSVLFLGLYKFIQCTEKSRSAVLNDSSNK
jgi:hypothetical protein